MLWKRKRKVRVHSHRTSMLTFASAFASNFNSVFMVMLTLMQKMGVEPVLCVCVLLPLLLLFSKRQTQTLTLSVNGPLGVNQSLPGFVFLKVCTLLGWCLCWSVIWFCRWTPASWLRGTSPCVSPVQTAVKTSRCEAGMSDLQRGLYTLQKIYEHDIALTLLMLN